jgi:hypothetical protein
VQCKKPPRKILGVSPTARVHKGQRRGGFLNIIAALPGGTLKIMLIGSVPSGDLQGKR